MGDYEARAREAVARADRRLKSWSFFGGKYEEAADDLERGANHFKLAKAWADAGETYVKLAGVQLKLDSKHDAATAWVEAAKAYMKIDQRRAVRCLQQAVALFTDMGRLGMAARQLREIAEVLEREGAKDEALTFFEQAADLYSTDASTSEANRCQLRVASLAAELEQYGRAVALFEEVARASLDNNLLKYSAKGYLLQAGLCVLCDAGPAALADKVERYKDMDAAFDGSREATLLGELAAAGAAGDADAFTACIAEYDSMTRLDAWKTALLLRAKRKLAAAEEAEEEDLT